jgi:CubicO group peptidase (beta-lactamase class C family)
MRQGAVMIVLLGVGMLAARAADEKGKSELLDAEVRKQVQSALTKHKVPALGVIITSSKGVQELHVEGVRKAGTKIKVEPGDKFHMGSNTKAFTAMLIAALVARKHLSYDLSLKKAFPEYADTMAPTLRTVTLDLLLRHRAGLQNDMPDWWEFSKKGTPRQQRQALLKVILTDKKANVKPDTVYSYSNLGYVLAGAMAERVMNDAYESLVRRFVLNPLKITTAGFGPTTMNKLRVEQPWGHEEDGEPFEPGMNADNPPVMNPAARLHLSLGDWAKYATDQLNGARDGKALLPAEMYKKLQEPANKDEPYSRGAWLVISAEKLFPMVKGNLLLHDGSNTFNYASAVIDPTRDYALLVVSNQGKKKGEESCGQVRNALLLFMVKRAPAGEAKGAGKSDK